MPRSARTIVDGGTYHVLTHGNNGQTVFHDDADYQRYLELLAAYAQRHQLRLFHFILMPDHVHLVLEAPVGTSLSKAMSGLNLAYAWVYRKRHQYRGHLWQGRFKSVLIDQDRELLECGRQIELSAVRGGLVAEPGQYSWSSYRAYADGARIPLLAKHPCYENLGASPRERQEWYRRFVHQARQQPVESPFGLPVSARGRGRPKLEGIARGAI